MNNAELADKILKEIFEEFGLCYNSNREILGKAITLAFAEKDKEIKDLQLQLYDLKSSYKEAKAQELKFLKEQHLIFNDGSQSFTDVALRAWGNVDKRIELLQKQAGDDLK